MDAAHYVEPPPAPDEALKTAESLRDEIQATSRQLHEHVEELRDHLDHRLESIRNPLGLRDRIAEYPLVSCGLALVAGVAVGAGRGSRVSRVLARRVGSTLGTTVVGHLARIASDITWRGR
jgi:hypothetical protein